MSVIPCELTSCDEEKMIQYLKDIDDELCGISNQQRVLNILSGWTEGQTDSIKMADIQRNVVGKIG